MRRARGASGQVVPLVALVVVAAGVGCLWLGRLGGAALARARAQTAADAAALAGAVHGRDAAEAVARANGVQLDRLQVVEGDTRVEVRRGRAHASARARPIGGDGAVGGDARDGGLASALRTALHEAGRLLGRTVPVTSGYRSSAEQAVLWARRGANPYPVAPPGTSMHERGLAVDVPLHFVPALLRVAPRVGLCRPYPVRDPVHFELCARPRGG